MMMNTGILRNVHVDEYGFKIADLTVAAMLKAYLQQITEEAAPGELERIVSPGMRGLRGGTVKSNGLQQKQWITINGTELAALIDRAKTAAAISATWSAQENEHLLKKTIGYIRNDVITGLNGKQYVAAMPAEMAEFITDCWLAVA